MSLVVRVKPEDVTSVRDMIVHQENAQVLVPTNPYEVFRIKVDDSYVVGYSSGKIVATTAYAGKALSRAVSTMGVLEVDYDVMIGSDEAGKGEWLGPIVVAAVGLTPGQSRALRSVGVMDSKELDMSRVRELATPIKSMSTAYRIVTIPPERFNMLMDELKNEQKTINDLLAWGHATALDAVYEATKVKHKRIRAMIDEFDRIKTEDRINRWIGLRNVPLIQLPRAEEEMAVASAGILARAARELWIDNVSNKMGVNLRSLKVIDIPSLTGQAHMLAKLSFVERATRRRA